MNMVDNLEDPHAPMIDWDLIYMMNKIGYVSETLFTKILDNIIKKLSEYVHPLVF